MGKLGVWSIAVAGCVVASACKRERAREIAPVELAVGSGSAIAKGVPMGVLAPSGQHADRIRPPKQIAWTKPTREPNSQEAVLAGTWVATVGDYATRSAYMADRVAFAFAPGKTQDVPQAAVEALAADNRISSSCIWLELRTDFTGIRRECMIVNGTPSAMDQNNIATGAKSDLGTRLEWFIDEADKNKLKIHFAADMIVPAPGPAGMRQLVFRHWTLTFAGEGEGENRFPISETIPEHDYEVPTRYVYEILSGAYLDP
jgi:hypothetical protein